MEFTRAQQMLLEAVKKAIRGEQVDWEQVSVQEWHALFDTATLHKLLPMVFEASYRCPAARAENPALSEEERGIILNGMRNAQRHSVREVLTQAAKTDAFLALYRAMEEKDIHPVVAKGLALRSIYPKEDHRPSSDEDILVSDEAWPRAIRFLTEYGMTPVGEIDEAAFEIGWRKGSLYIELHRRLFDPGSNFGNELLNALDGALDRAVPFSVKDGTEIRTLCPNDHLLFLILHAYKHFVLSGFGLRQAADIGLFSEHFREEIDWPTLREKCRAAHAETFAAAVLNLAETTFETDAWGKEADGWRLIPADPEPMLADLLDAGLYGTASMTRLHTATVTRNQVEASRSNKKASVWKSVFPSREKLVHEYPELEKHPMRLPIVWVKRLCRYRKETKSMDGNDTAATLRMAKERTELLRYYGILD